MSCSSRGGKFRHALAVLLQSVCPTTSSVPDVSVPEVGVLKRLESECLGALKKPLSCLINIMMAATKNNGLSRHGQMETLATDFVPDEVFEKSFDCSEALIDGHVKTMETMRDAKSTVDDELVKTVADFIFREFVNSAYAVVLKPQFLCDFVGNLVPKMSELAQLVNAHGKDLLSDAERGVLKCDGASLSNWFDRLYQHRSGFRTGESAWHIADMIKCALTQKDQRALEILVPDPTIFDSEEYLDHFMSKEDWGSQKKLMLLLRNEIDVDYNDSDESYYGSD